MAVSNFGISFGAIMLGQTDAMGGLPAIFLVVGGGLLLALGLMMFVKYPRRPEFYAAQSRAGANIPPATQSAVQ